MDQQRESPRTGSIAPSSLAGCAPQAVAGATQPVACVAGQRSRSLWVPRAGVDGCTSGECHQARVWGKLSSHPLQPSPQGHQTQRPETGKPSEPTRCPGHPDLARATSDRAKKKAEEEARTIVFVDESAFYLLPMAVRTYAPVGQTPILTVPLTRDHLSAIGGLTPDGRLFLQIQDHSYTSPDVMRFLQMLLRKIQGKLLIIWDGAPIRRSRVVKDFLSAGGATRLHLERLPASAPEVNPQEGVWNLLKRRELKNLCAADLVQLRTALIHAKERLRHRTHALCQCFAHAGFLL